MTLRSKTLLIISVTLLGLLVGLYVTSRVIVLGGFAELEEQETRRSVERVLNAFAGDLSTLDATTDDWASWDDTYTFIENANDTYVQSNLSDETFVAIGLNLMLYIHSSGRIVFSKAYDLNKEKQIPVPESLPEHLSPDGLLLSHPDTDSSMTGLLSLPEGPMLIAAQPILTSKDEGPIRGTLIFGHYLDPAEIQRLAQVTLSSLVVHQPSDPQMPSDFKTALSSLSEKSPILVRPLSSESVAGYTLLHDIYGKPTLVLRVDMPREVYTQGRTTVLYFLLALLVTGLGISGVMLLLLDKLVVSRLARLSAGVSTIGASGDVTARVSITGRDELSDLSNFINGMLEALERSQTVHKQACEELRKLNETQRRMVAMITHESRTPLTSIQGYANLLLDEESASLLSPEQRKSLDAIVRNSKRLSSLVDSFLDLERMEAGMLQLNRCCFPLEEVLTEVTDSFRLRAQQKNLELRTELERSLLVCADNEHLTQVFSNLIMNAIKFSDSGMIRIKASRAEDRVLVEVTDQGQGIPKQDLPHIFEKFYQARHLPEAKPSRGTGLGLAIVKAIVEEHGGTVEVKSTLDKGSTLSVTLPLASDCENHHRDDQTKDRSHL